MEFEQGKYFSVVTDLGLREIMKAVSMGEKVRITEYAVGDGGGEYYRPDAGMQKLRHEVWRGTVNSCRVSGESENVMVIESVIPADTGGFVIREMGIFSDEGVMIAVCNTAETHKVRVMEGIVQEMVLSMRIVLGNTDAVQLLVDEAVVMVTRKDLAELQGLLEKRLELDEQELGRVSGFAAENRDMIHALQDGAESTGIRLGLLELMYATDISKNPFTVTFADLDGIVAEGVWNEPQKRLEF